jgi:hypothetical protein
LKATSSPDAARFIEEVRGDRDPDFASYLRIEERWLPQEVGERVEG